jgi:signal transduction histidine kinase
VGIVGLLGYTFSQATTNEFRRFAERDFLDYERLVNPYILQKLENFMRFRRVDCDQSLEAWQECEADPIPYTSAALTEFQSLVEELANITGTRIVVADSLRRIIANSEWGGESFTEELDLTNASGVYVIDGAIFLVYIDLTDESGISASQNAFLRSVNHSLAIAVGSAMAATILLTIMLSRRILRPVEALTRAARRLGEGDLSQRVPDPSGDEIGELAAAFNSMADGLSRLEELRRHLVTDVAHELRTPLSNIRGYLEAVQDGLAEPEPQLINSLHEEVLLLSHLVDDLQDLALAEAGKLHLNPSRIHIQEIVAKTLLALRRNFEGKSLQAVNDLSPVLPPVLADPDRIAQVIRNLINNAIVYTPEGGRIRIFAEVTASQIEICIEDNGVGIAPEHLSYVFERFYRADESRARATGGAGLGLAIVKQLVQAHGGKVSVSSTLGSGSTFRFSLPR